VIRLRPRKYIYNDSDDEPKQKKSAWHHFFMIVLVVLFSITAVFMQGCAAPKSRELRAIEEHQVEGMLVYREAEGVKYYVECEHGLKYLSSTASDERIGPVDVCDGEEE
jgi:hypothetical protein